MIKLKNKSKVLIIITFTLLMAIIVTGCLGSTNAPQYKMNSQVMAVNDVQELRNETITVFSNAPNGGDGTIGNPYSKSPWSDRIVVEVNVTGSYYIHLNIDPRNSIFGDDIIVEFQYYYKDYEGKHQTSKLFNFIASVDFNTTDKGVVNRTFNKANDSVAGFTYNSNSTKCNKVNAKITAKFGDQESNKKEIYFLFT